MARTSSSEDDEAALVAFRDEASPGSTLASWNGSTAFCSWEGVACSHGRNPPRVVGLSLPKRGLAGTLSTAIGNLTFLRALELGFNALHGNVPTSIGRLRRLRFLDLGYNAFTGEFPANLSFCIAMETMFLDSNNLGGRIPPELGNSMTHLQLLRLKNNSFTGPVPASLANMSSLYYLDLANNKFDGVIPPGLADITGLQLLDLSVNSLNGALPLSLYNLSSVRVFHVEGNWLHGSIPSDIGSKFPAMKDFSLANNMFTGGIPSSISNLTNLTSLQLSLNGFTGLVPQDLGRLQRLQILYMSYNLLEADDRAGWEFITSLANCSQLLQLSLSYNSFHGQLPSSVVNLSATLQYLYLSDCSISGSIPQDISNLVGLSILDFSNTSISGVIPESIGKLANLVQLGLYRTRLSGLIPVSLGNVSQLNRLLAYSAKLEGPIPASLGKLRNLYVLDLSANYQLNGSIPKEIFLPSLSSGLNLSYNSLSGPLPSQVGYLINLNQLILSGNQLSSQIPDTIGNCIVLESLLLDDNMFEGSIPQPLKNIKGLKVLNLTANNLSDGIPDALRSIGALQELYVAHNNLTGLIPAYLQNLTSLLAFDASFNDLQGQVPNRGVFGNLTAISITGNTKLCGGIPQLHLPPCSTYPVSDRKKHRSKSLAVSLATTLAVLLLVFSITVVTIWKHKGPKSQAPPPAIIEEHFQRVSYHALLRGTDGFSESNLLGKGRYGSVYRCTLEAEDTPVAVKVFDLQQSGSSNSFEAECEALRSVRHRCLIKIITCCSSIDNQGREFKALVIELMPNGSLDAWLHPKHSNYIPNNTLSLAQRLDISVHVMDALDYLHNHCLPLIVHCDVKPSNILLAEDMSARVGDFGISRILLESASKTQQNSSSTIGIRGSIGYVAPGN
jgi:Leucine-rich repeat (LRR) protein